MITRDPHPTAKQVEWDVRLETLDGNTVVQFAIQGERGRNPFQIARSAFPRTSTQLAQGGTKYDDFEPPFRPVVQEDWSGGRASENLESDKTRFMDSLADTATPGKFFLTGLPTWIKADRSKHLIDLPGDVTWHKLGSEDFNYRATSAITMSADGDSVMLYLRPTGTPSDLTVYIYTSSAGDPNTAGAGDTVAVSSWPYQQGMGGYAFTINATGTTGTVHIGVGDPNGDATDYWEVACDETKTGKVSNNNSSWQDDAGSPYYMAFETNQGTDVDASFKMFEYKGGTYFASVPADGSNSALYMAGDRGLADDNSSFKNRLIDATKSWTNDEWIGYYVMVRNGPGSGESHPYRKITDNTSTYLVVEPDWEVTHTTDTEYVILSDAIQQVNSDLGGVVSDVVVAGDSVFFARGDDTAILRYREYNKSGVWTTESRADTLAKAYGLMAKRDSVVGDHLWASLNNDDHLGPHLRQYHVPVGWGDLRYTRRTLQAMDAPWGDFVASGVTTGYSAPDRLVFTNTAASSGTWVSQELSSPFDLLDNPSLGLSQRITGSVPTTTLKLSDTTYRNRKFQATSALVAHRPYRLAKSVVMSRAVALPTNLIYHDSGGSPEFTSILNIAIGDEEHEIRFTYDNAADYIYIGHTDQFDALQVTISSANTNSQTMDTPQFWNGKDGWVNVGGFTDNTQSAGKTLATTNSVTFTKPDSWTAGGGDDTNLDGSLFWLRLSFTGALTAVLIDKIELTNSVQPSACRSTEALALLSDGGNAAASEYDQYIWRFDTDDWMYILSDDPFDTIKVVVGQTTPQNEVATLTAQYFNGEAFVAVSGWSDSTISSGKTLATSEDATWDLEDDMEQVTINGVTGYCIRLQPSADLTTDFELVEIAVRNSGEYTFDSIDVVRHGEDATIGVNIEPDEIGFIYLCGSRRFDAIDWNIGGNKNNDAATLAIEYFDGNDWSAATVSSDGTESGGRSLGQSGVMQFHTGSTLMQPSEVNGTSGYWVRVSWSAASFDLVEVRSIGLRRNQTVDIALSGPTVSAGVWYTLSGTFQASTTARNGVDVRAIAAVDISLSAAPDTYEVRGGLLSINPQGRVVTGFDSERINNMVLWGDADSNPWVLTNRSVYEVQTENNNIVVELPLPEIASLSSIISGRFAVSNDVHLWLNIANFVHRLFSGTLEHVGYTRDAGLPDDRLGSPSMLYSMPGRVLIAVDSVDGRGSGSYSPKVGTSGFGTLLASYGSTLHEIFRSPVGMSINAAQHQSIPGPDTVDRLWLNVGPFICHIPLANSSLDPTDDSDYVYAPDGYVMTGWISGGFLDIEKLYDTVKLATEGLSTNVNVTVYYQADTGSHITGWTKAVEQLTVSPFDTTQLNSTYVNAKRLRLMFVLNTNDSSSTPIVSAYVLDTILRFPTKNQWTFPVVFSDNEPGRLGHPEKNLVGLTAAAQIDTWSDTPVALRFYSPQGLFDNKIVMVEPPGARPVPPEKQGGRMMYSITLIEI